MIRLIKEEQATPQNINPAQSDFFVLLSEWEQYKKDLTPPQIRPISDLSTVDPETEVVTFRWPCADFEDDFLVDPHKSVNGLFGFLEPGSDFRDGKYKEINKPDPKTIAAIRQHPISHRRILPGKTCQDCQFLNTEPCRKSHPNPEWPGCTKHKKEAL